MRFGRVDPGDCLICGAAHCSCGGGPIEVVQLPNRDAAAARSAAGPHVGSPREEDADPAAAPFGDGSDDRPVTTATYRGKKKPRA